MAATTPVDRLGPGDHACLTFSDPQERLDILAAFVAAGRFRGEKVICFADTEEDLRSELLERGIDAGSDVTVVRSEQLWAGTAASDAATMVEVLVRQVRRSAEPVERTLITAGAADVPALRMLVRHGER